MREMIAGLLLVALCTMPAEAQTIAPALRRQLEAIAAFVTDGYATYEGPSVVRRGAVNTPWSGQMVVLFSLSSWGGGNGSRQYLAVLQHNDAAIRFPDGPAAKAYSLRALVQTGEDFDRYFHDVQLTGDRVVLTGHSWATADAHCCPTVDVTTSYRLSSRGLNEVAAK